MTKVFVTDPAHVTMYQDSDARGHILNREKIVQEVSSKSFRSLLLGLKTRSLESFRWLMLASPVSATSHATIDVTLLTRYSVMTSAEDLAVGHADFSTPFPWSSTLQQSNTWIIRTEIRLFILLLN